MTPTLAYRLATTVPEKANEVLIEHGYQPARNVAELEYRITDFILDDEKTALAALKTIHPDRELFESSFGNSHHGNSKHSNCCGHGSNFSGDNYSNCSGCGGTCGSKMSNASGSSAPIPQPNANQMISGNLVTAIMGLTIIGIAALIILKR